MAQRAKNVQGHLKPLRYTVSSSKLSQQEQEFYEENGYLLIRNLVPESELQKYKQRFIDLADGKVEKPMTMTVMKDLSLVKKLGKNIRGEDVINKIQDYQDDEVLFPYCQLPKVLDYVEAIIGPNIKAMHTMLINKPPNAGETGRHPLHQDLHYFPFRPEDRIVCSWTAIEHCKKENGCLVVLPGTHKGALLNHEYPEWESGVNAMYHGIQGVNNDQKYEYVYCEMNPGDTLLFHPLLIHGSGANVTTSYRKAISCHFAASECEYIDVYGTSQENIAKEVEGMAEKRAKTKLSFQMVWQLKGRLVRGEERTL